MYINQELPELKINIDDDLAEFIKQENIEKIKTLAPEMQKATVELYEECRKQNLCFQIVSAWRSFEEQEQIYKMCGDKYPTQVMPPGKSPHQAGLAIDIKIGESCSYSEEYNKIAQIWKEKGHYWGGDDIDEYWHFEIETGVKENVYK